MVESHAVQCTLRSVVEPDLLPIGHWSQGAAFTPDGKRIFVGNMVEKDIQVFSLDGTVLRDTGVRIAVKGGPAAIRTADK